MTFIKNVFSQINRFFVLFFFTDPKLSFEPRNVTVKKNVDAKKFYDLLSEIGR